MTEKLSLSLIKLYLTCINQEWHSIPARTHTHTYNLVDKRLFEIEMYRDIIIRLQNI